MEKQIKREEIYNGKVINVVVDDIETENKLSAKRELVLHRGGACIAVLDQDGKYYMVKQYRYALGKELLEFCAGKLEIGENPDDAIIREVNEELGIEVKDVEKVGTMIPTCGYSNEIIHLYIGKAGQYIGQHFDDDEYLNIEKYTLKEINEMIDKGIINDAKTICLAYHLNKR